MPGAMAHACNPSTSEAEEEELPQIHGQSGPCPSLSHTQQKRLNELNYELNMKQMMDKFLVSKSNPLSTKLRCVPLRILLMEPARWLCRLKRLPSNPWERTNSHRLLWPPLNEMMHHPNIKLSFKLKRNSSTQEAEARGLRLAWATRWDSKKSAWLSPPILQISYIYFGVYTYVNMKQGRVTNPT